MHAGEPTGAGEPSLHVATFLQDLAGGGAERVAVLLMNGLARTGIRTTLLLARREGPYLSDVDPAVDIIDFGGRKSLACVRPLARWLRAEKPDILMTHLTHVNVVGAIANRLAGQRVPQVAVEHNQMGLNYERLSSTTVKLAYRAAGFLYPDVARVVGVSSGVRDAVLAFTGNRGGNYAVIHNPVVTDELKAKAREVASHPWLNDDGDPVILGCGRLNVQKGFDILIEAFAKVRARRPARLLILGEGDLRDDLEASVATAGLAPWVALPGFDRNPFAAMRSASVFALSSRWEGLPTVLIEALASGANVVSTDCPSGPDEVLEGGRHGRLVPVGDAEALAGAIIDALDRPTPVDAAMMRADDFTLDRAVENYRLLFASLRNASAPR